MTECIIPGVIVRLKTGEAPILIIKITTEHYDNMGTPAAFGFYVKSECEARARPVEDYTLWEPDNTEEWYNIYNMACDLANAYGVPMATAPQEEDLEIDKLTASTKGNEAMTNKLYQTIVKEGETAQFGTYLAKNSAGQIILEMKGSNDCVAFDPKAIEEVLPWTFLATVVSSNRNNKVGSDVTLVGKKDSVEAGDILLSENAMLRVVSVNTKNRNTNAVFKGRKLVTVDVDQVSSDEVPEVIESD